MTTSKDTRCPLCLSHPAEITRLEMRDAFRISCDLCGGFALTGTAFEVLKHEYWRLRWKVICGATRSATKRGVLLEYTAHTLDAAFKSAPVPQSPLDVLDRLLLSIAERARPFSAKVSIAQAEYLDFYLDSPEDLKEMLTLLESAGHIARSPFERDRLVVQMTLSGWERARLVESPHSAGSRAFVAMSFASEYNSAWTDGIKPALEHLGYLPIRVDELPHLQKIDDRIIAELRQCDLVVADFSGHRAGVYFEAGFALGRGVPVVWCCRSDDIENAHFDTRQYNHVTWTAPEELRTRLEERIRATLPLPVGSP